MELNSHCSYCGKEYYDQTSYPRSCISCGNLVWRNPLPVIVTIIPCEYSVVGTNGGIGFGVVGIRRGIEPKKGLLALPGGFIEYGESWQAAAARELFEETGIEIHESLFKLFDSKSSPDGSKILIFATIKSFIILPEFKENSEVTELVILNGDEELAFPSHTEVLRNYLMVGG